MSSSLGETPLNHVTSGRPQRGGSSNNNNSRGGGSGGRSSNGSGNGNSYGNGGGNGGRNNNGSGSGGSGGRNGNGGGGGRNNNNNGNGNGGRNNNGSGGSSGGRANGDGGQRHGSGGGDGGGYRRGGSGRNNNGHGGRDGGAPAGAAPGSSSSGAGPSEALAAALAAARISGASSARPLQPPGRGESSSSSSSSSSSTEVGSGGVPFEEWIIRDSRQLREAKCVDYGLLTTVPEVSRYSSLLPRQIPQVAKILGTYAGELGEGQVVVDATAHIGCDTFNFRAAFPRSRIVAVELEPQAFACLQANISAVGGGITAVNADCVQYLASESAPKGVGLLYFDPPWGGVDYRKQEAVQLALSGRPLAAVVSAALKQTQAPLALVKAPKNFDLGHFSAGLEGCAVARLQSVQKPASRASPAPEVTFYIIEVRPRA